jgi:capsular polysaccharide export protein
LVQDFIDENVDISEFIVFRENATLMERKAKLLSPAVIDKQFDWLCRAFKNYFNCYSVDKLLFWNGERMLEYIASAVAEQFKVDRLFFEIGNFPNKIFIDPKGVNAKSSLIDRDLSICDNYDENMLTDFLTSHKRTKESAHLVPQANTRNKIIYSEIYDLIWSKFQKYPILQKDYNVLKTLVEKRIAHKYRAEYDQVNLETLDYILLPLQVSVDSQVLKNSDTNIEESISYAIKNAVESNLSLLIKPHPAEKVEKRVKINEHIKSLKKKHGNIYLTNANTYQLIKHSKKVITINSTVGIEALMYFKHVEVLGRAIYKPYCQPDLTKPVDQMKIKHFLYSYLFNCLKNGSLFDKGQLDINIFDVK